MTWEEKQKIFTYQDIYCKEDGKQTDICCYYKYYDIEKQTIARFPSNSNLLLKGSDNSLYFGMTSNSSIKKIFCDFFLVQRCTCFRFPFVRVAR